jgi:hypothetical protein
LVSALEGGTATNDGLVSSAMECLEKRGIGAGDESEGSALGETECRGARGGTAAENFRRYA